jgi:hypothetical protein
MRNEATGDGVKLQEARGQRSASFRLRAAMGKVERVRPMLYFSVWAGFVGGLLLVFASVGGRGDLSSQANLLATHVGLLSLLLLALPHTANFGRIVHYSIAEALPENGLGALFWSVYFWVTVYYRREALPLGQGDP